ncbi:MAG: cytochrome c biogenesis protein CcsA [Anaerolineales bacterium]|jgi:heme exporter protein C|nr:cytochrome c biogenesis protein CcsA [Anaerolineales bacterium]
MSAVQPSRSLRILTISAFLLVLLSLYMVFVYAPREVVMGAVQRVFYYHVAAGWIGALAFLVTLIVSILYLATNNIILDRIAVSSVEIGVVFTSMNIASGSIWARPIWNTWWTWDPRLTTATVMWLLYIAYLMLRQGLEDPERQRRFAAVYGILAFASVPLTFLAIRIWRTIHPVVIGSNDPGAEGQFDMTMRMRFAFFFSLFTFTVLYTTLLWHRVRLEGLACRVAIMKARLLHDR